MLTVQTPADCEEGDCRVIGSEQPSRTDSDGLSVIAV